MNKKFSTLVAGFALLGAMSVGAQNPVLPTLQGSLPVDKLKTDDNGLYQLSNDANDAETLADSVLYMTNDGKLEFVAAPTHSDSLANTLWCVSIAASSNQGQSFKYDFLNKGTGQRLDITMEGNIADFNPGNPAMPLVSVEDSVYVGGEIAGWAFANNYETKLSRDNYLFSYFTADSVVGLAVQQEGVFLIKDLADNAIRQQNNNFKKFTLRKAAEIILSANEINTLFDLQASDKGVQLKFTPDVQNTSRENPFNAKKFFARQVTSLSGAADTVKYVYVARADSSYLRVDTAYTNPDASAAKFLAYNWTSLTTKILTDYGYTVAEDSLNNSELKAQHQFLFTYKPSVDSVTIRVNQAIFHRKETEVANRNLWYTADTIRKHNAFVALQSLDGTSNGARLLTVDTIRQNTHIQLGYVGCTPVGDNKYSLPNGLYIIRNEKQQVLAAPIHGNGNTVEWVTLDEQDPEHMPAYQWLIWRTQEAESLASSSPVMLTNREFDGQTSTIQLAKDDEGKIMTASSLFGLNVASLNFDQIEDSAIIKDEKLGYKWLKPSDLLVEKYKFNYLHPYSDDKWIGRNAKNSKDSILYAQDELGSFTLLEGNYDKYGVNVTPAILKKIPGLAQLHRTQYVVVMGNDYLVEAAEDKYAVGAVNYQTTKVDSFYFKANNFYENKDYYAIIEAYNAGTGSTFNAYDNQILDDAHKVGTADDGKTAVLKVQNLKETRTSAFTVEPTDAPLYRRFNNAELEGNEGDASDTLRFVEEYRGELLQIEGNKNFKVPGVDFLGIYTESAAPSGLSFIVDTAWVERGLGYVKPQYLISIERTDIKGHEFERCPTCQALIAAGKEPIENCPHDIQATPDMRFGKYLVNFADSIAAGKMVTADKGYNWKEYDRAGFVKAIQYGDSLYILKDQFAGVTKDDVNLALLEKIKKANDAMIAAGKDDNGRLVYIKNLTTDKHKYVTWSMRYIKPGTSDQKFLIESMKDVNHKNAYGTTTTGFYGANAYASLSGDIAPQYAAWLKMQNGCLVLSDSHTSKFDEITGGDDALIFDVKHVADDEIATDNEVIEANTIKVVAGEGNVTVYGAAGKKVTVSDIVGHATTVIATSDAEVIPASAGVVIVKVDDATVKTVVE
ncbi:DUF6383 domain-containing protein [Parabacteroides bouchesdurhonensis]|uniref:DUF6383 domain-containing protein n=1 Tax=Parabacteroides bouchesdurhonensis TaxID=1936995 RepID=UPI000C85F7BF|nr:DUF6383 domain-containing protein [Parabacteroides bouchesdurhonensis]